MKFYQITSHKKKIQKRAKEENLSKIMGIQYRFTTVATATESTKMNELNKLLEENDKFVIVPVLGSSSLHNAAMCPFAKSTT